MRPSEKVWLPEWELEEHGFGAAGREYERKA